MPADPVVALLPVTQADRDAVQAFHRTMLARLMSDVKSQRPKLGDDEGDAGTLVQAFARHRLAHRTPAPTGDVPSGWQLVPVEPTEAMIEAYHDSEIEPESAWLGMLEAAPSPTSSALSGSAEVLREALERIANSERAAGIYDTLGNAAIARAALTEGQQS